MTMKKINKAGVLPGPQAALLSGFSDEERESISLFFGDEKESIAFIPLVKPMLIMTLKEVLSAQETESTPLTEKEVPRVMILSGISMEMVHTVLDNLRDSGMSRPIIATTTEHNLSFTIKELLMHLLEEQRELH